MYNTHEFEANTSTVDNDALDVTTSDIEGLTPIGVTNSNTTHGGHGNDSIYGSNRYKVCDINIYISKYLYNINNTIYFYLIYLSIGM